MGIETPIEVEGEIGVESDQTGGFPATESDSKVTSSWCNSLEIEDKRDSTGPEDAF